MVFDLENKIPQSKNLLFIFQEKYLLLNANDEVNSEAFALGNETSFVLLNDTAPAAKTPSDTSLCIPSKRND